MNSRWLCPLALALVVAGCTPNEKPVVTNEPTVPKPNPSAKNNPNLANEVLSKPVTTVTETPTKRIITTVAADGSKSITEQYKPQPKIDAEKEAKLNNPKLKKAGEADIAAAGIVAYPGATAPASGLSVYKRETEFGTELHVLRETTDDFKKVLQYCRDNYTMRSSLERQKDMSFEGVTKAQDEIQVKAGPQKGSKMTLIEIIVSKAKAQ